MTEFAAPASTEGGAPRLTGHNPSLPRVLLALAVAPAAWVLPFLPFFFQPMGAGFGGFVAMFSYGIALIFFAPMYFILWRYFAMSRLTILVIGAGATLLALLVAVAFGAVDIHLTPYRAMRLTPHRATIIAAVALFILQAVTSYVFWLMTKPGRSIQALRARAIPRISRLGEKKGVSAIAVAKCTS